MVLSRQEKCQWDFCGLCIVTFLGTAVRLAAISARLLPDAPIIRLNQFITSNSFFRDSHDSLFGVAECGPRMGGHINLTHCQAICPQYNKMEQARYSPPWADTSIIGIAGSSGSGKTSLALEVVSSLNLPWVVILSMVDHPR